MPAGLHFGPGSLNVLGNQNVKLPGSKALIVTGGSSVKRHGYLDRVQQLLRTRGVESVVFDKVQPNPIVEHVMEAAEMARESGCDFVIGLGGGSSMDSAKSIAVMLNNPGHYWDYVSGGSGKGLPIPHPVAPIDRIELPAFGAFQLPPYPTVQAVPSRLPHTTPKVPRIGLSSVLKRRFFFAGKSSPPCRTRDYPRPQGRFPRRTYCTNYLMWRSDV